MFVNELSNEFPIRTLCSALSVDVSSFYAWKRHDSYSLSDRKTSLAQKVKVVFHKHKRRYGAKRIVAELKEDGIKIGRSQVRTLMKAQCLVAIQPKSFVPKTTQSDPSMIRSPNLLLERADVSRPREVFIGDITYLPLVCGGFIYLATWLDMFTHEIVGWDLQDKMPSSLIINALQKAIDKYDTGKGLIIHSDGGGQYGAIEFRRLLEKHQFVQSMTRRNNHYDNAMGESLFSRLKAELMEKGAFLSLDDAQTELFEYIEIYYNRQRRHSSIGYEIPVRFAEKWKRLVVANCESTEQNDKENGVFLAIEGLPIKNIKDKE